MADSVNSSSAANFSVLTLTAPVAMGYIPLGMVFGFLFVQAGAAWWLAILTSVFVFAGAAQYMMVPMVAAGLPLGAIALATLIVNSRHIFYGTLPKNTSLRQMALIALFNHSWWILGSVIGAIIGAQAQINLVGLDFVLAALFAVLTVEQWRTRKSAMPLWVALVAYAIAYFVAAKHALVIAIVLSIAAAVFWQPKAEVSHV